MKHKYNAMMADVFRETFWWLPLGHVLNRRVLVVHGGLFSRDGVKLDDIRAVNRYRCLPLAASTWSNMHARAGPVKPPLKPGCYCELIVNLDLRVWAPGAGGLLRLGQLCAGALSAYKLPAP